MKPKWLPVPKNAGVFVWHEKNCPAYEDKRCRCNRKFRGEVWNPTTKRPDKQSPAVYDVNEAITWVADKKLGNDPTTTPAPVEMVGFVVREFFDRFMKAARAGTALRKGGKRYASRTLDSYESAYRHHVDEHAGDMPVAVMDAEAWQAVVDAIILTGQKDRKGNPTGEELAAGTVNTILAGIRAAYRWGAAPGRRIVTGRPLREVEIPQGGKPKRKRVAAPEIIPALLAALTGKMPRGGPANPAVRIAWAIMFYAGLRISEVIALDWPDVELTRDGGWITVGESKSEAGTDRRIPIALPLARILNAWRAECDGARLGPVVPGKKAFRIRPSGIASLGERRWPKAGLPIFTPHEARHTFASAVIANRDVSLADLQEWLGHASIATTAVYVKTLPGYRSESAGARISGAFG